VFGSAAASLGAKVAASQIAMIQVASEIASLTNPRIKLNKAERKITNITTTSTTVMKFTCVFLNGYYTLLQAF
jgi:hypothetical protein